MPPLPCGSRKATSFVDHCPISPVRKPAFGKHRRLVSCLRRARQSLAALSIGSSNAKTERVNPRDVGDVAHYLDRFQWPMSVSSHVRCPSSGTASAEIRNTYSPELRIFTSALPALDDKYSLCSRRHNDSGSFLRPGRGVSWIAESARSQRRLSRVREVPPLQRRIRHPRHPPLLNIFYQILDSICRLAARVSIGLSV